jgi:hypothetical protein
MMDEAIGTQMTQIELIHGDFVATRFDLFPTA